MRISPIESMKPLTNIGGIGKTSGKPEGAGSADAVAEFGDAMKNAVKQVNTLQNQADDVAVKLASGDVEDVHKAMLAMQKAKLAFDFTVQVRNRVIDAYQEIMRMQV